MPEDSDRDWLGWTEADHVQLFLKVGWAADPSRQGLEDSLDFFAIVIYCAHTRRP